MDEGIIWYQLGFSLGLPQKWGFGWGGGASSDPPQNRNPNPKDSTTLNNLSGYSLTLADASQVCK